MCEADGEWLAKAADGDADALTALLEQHGPQVRRGLSLAGQWQTVFDLDDVMQVTYAEAFLRIGQCKATDAASFLAWLRQIAQNNLRDAIRLLEREKEPPPAKRVEAPQSDDSYVALLDMLGASSTTPSRIAAANEAKTMLESFIKELPQSYAEVTRLYDLEGMSGPQVAKIMGRSRGAVVLLRMRAHDRLRELLGSASKFFSRG